MTPTHTHAQTMEIYTKHIAHDPSIHNFAFFTAEKPKQNQWSVGGRAAMGTPCYVMEGNGRGHSNFQYCLTGSYSSLHPNQVNVPSQC